MLKNRKSLAVMTMALLAAAVLSLPASALPLLQTTPTSTMPSPPPPPPTWTMTPTATNAPRCTSSPYPSPTWKFTPLWPSHTPSPTPGAGGCSGGYLIGIHAQGDVFVVAESGAVVWQGIGGSVTVNANGQSHTCNKIDPEFCEGSYYALWMTAGQTITVTNGQGAFYQGEPGDCAGPSPTPTNTTTPAPQYTNTPGIYVISYPDQAQICSSSASNWQTYQSAVYVSQPGARVVAYRAQMIYSGPNTFVNDFTASTPIVSCIGDAAPTPGYRPCREGTADDYEGCVSAFAVTPAKGCNMYPVSSHNHNPGNIGFGFYIYNPTGGECLTFSNLEVAYYGNAPTNTPAPSITPTATVAPTLAGACAVVDSGTVVDWPRVDSRDCYTIVPELDIAVPEITIPLVGTVFPGLVLDSPAYNVCINWYTFSIQLLGYDWTAVLAMIVSIIAISQVVGVFRS